ncbi:MAG: C40 family peptidase [Desulfovibrio sp.]|uniref:C40 family peptidase n=1 Tax=Desulfovibrio sp. TaxID=885 RepID=UPI002A35A6F1|nr:C40 family peptidase [Desulfovibrio sp.]MDY0260728.1 C40 family peptidase [Desulfovibrio sp.]
MGKCLKLCVLMLACMLAFGCASKSGSRDNGINTPHAERFRRSYEAAFDSNQQESSQQLLRKARSAIGTPYVRGGTTPDGFDCSGFVCWTYKSVGVQLPRTAREQSVIGQRINNVDEMRAGDIVAFRHPRRGYHTGIYVGDGKFIHSPHKRTRVRINSLDDPYFKSTFLGARRVKVEGGETMIAQAESRLNDFAEERVVRELSRDKKKAGKTSARDSKRDDSRDDSRSKKKDKIVQVASNDKKSSATTRQQASAPEKSSKASSSEKSSKASGSEKSSKASASEKSSKASNSEKSSKASGSEKSSKASASEKSSKASSSEKSSKASAQASSGKSSAQASSSKGSADKDKTAKSSSQKAETKKSESKKPATEKVATKAEPKSKKDQPKGKGDNS